MFVLACVCVTGESVWGSMRETACKKKQHVGGGGGRHTYSTLCTRRLLLVVHIFLACCLSNALSALVLYTYTFSVCSGLTPMLHMWGSDA